MQYNTLHDLIQNSSSSRMYFLSLPVEMQLALHEHDQYIHTAAELHFYAKAIEDYNHHIRISENRIYNQL